VTTGIPRGHPIVAFLVARSNEVGRAAGEKLEEIAVLDHYGRQDHADDPYHCPTCGPGYPCAPIRQAAARFANHPDYDESWRP
jgi:hypothetical protein